MDRAARFKALPFRKKLLVYASAAIIFGATIAYIAFIQVTLSKAFELAEPWDTVKVFLVVSGALIAFYRLAGLHRPY